MKTRRGNLTLYLIMILFTAHVSALSTIVAELSNEPGVGVSGSGLIFTVNYIGYILCALPCGALADRFGKKPVLLAGLGGAAVFFALFASVSSFPMHCLMMFFLGGCGGVVNCITAGYIGDVNPDDPDYYTNFLQMLACIGAIASPFLLSLLISLGVQWRYYYYVLSLLTVVFAVLLIVFVPNTEKREGERFSFGKAFSAMKGVFLLACLCMFCYTGAEVATWGWLSSLLKTEFASSTLLSGLGVSLFWVGMTAGRYVCGRLLKRITMERLLIVLSALAALVTLGALFCRTAGVFLIMAVLLGLACSSTFPFLSSYGAARTALGTGMSFTLLMVCGNTGSAIVPYFVGLLSERIGMTSSMALPMVLFAAVGVIVTGIALSSRKTAQKR